MWPSAGITSTRWLSRAASVTMWVTWRVPTSSRSSNSSANAGMNVLYASMGIGASSNVARLLRAVDRGLGEGAGATDVVDAGVGEHHPLHREFEALDGCRERLPLRTHHQGVDHGDAVVVDHHAGIRGA